MRTTAFTVVSAFAFVGLLLPTGWQWKTRNFGILLYIFWVSCALVPGFINSIIWRDNANDVAPVWCDITTKLNIGAQYGILCADLCSSRYLYLAASTKSLSISRRNRTIFDVSFTVGFPILIMVLHVIVQGHRYDILEGIGCNPAVYWSIPAIFILTLPSIVLALASAVYQVMAMVHFIQQRRSFSAILSSSSSALTPSRFIRLLCLCSVGVAINLPIVLYLTIVGHATAGSGLQPWTSWAEVHLDFWFVWKITAQDWALIISAGREKALFLNQWLPAIAAILFFLFFGIGREAFLSYKTNSFALLRLFGIKKFAGTDTLIGSGSMSGSKSGVTISFPRTPNTPAGASFQTRSAGSEKDLDRDVEKGVVVDASMEYLPEIPPFQRVARESESKLPGVTLTVEKESAER